MNLEDELRSALKPREPSPDFAARVIAAAERQPVRHRPSWSRWVAAIAACVLLAAGGEGYRQYEGQRAKSQVLLALKITATKLNKAQRKVLMLHSHRS